MESARFQLLPLLGAALLLLLPLLGARAQEDAELQPRALDIFSAVEDASHEKELVGIPMPQAPLGCPAAPPVYLLPPLLPTPFPESGRGEMSEKSGLPLSSSQQSCPLSSEQHRRNTSLPSRALGPAVSTWDSAP